MRAWTRAHARDHNARAWLAFHIAVIPHQKRPVRLQDLMIKPDGTASRQGHQSLAEMDTVMRQWRVAMAFHEAATPAPKPKKPKR